MHDIKNYIDLSIQKMTSIIKWANTVQWWTTVLFDNHDNDRPRIDMQVQQIIIASTILMQLLHKQRGSLWLWSINGGFGEGVNFDCQMSSNVRCTRKYYLSQKMVAVKLILREKSQWQNIQGQHWGFSNHKRWKQYNIDIISNNKHVKS